MEQAAEVPGGEEEVWALVGSEVSAWGEAQALLLGQVEPEAAAWEQASVQALQEVLREREEEEEEELRVAAASRVPRDSAPCRRLC